jgi:hypothetical protein
VCQANGGYPGTRKAAQKMIRDDTKSALFEEEGVARGGPEVGSWKKVAEDAVLERSMHACC